MLQLLVNDKPITVEKETTVNDLLLQLGYTKGSVAVALDGQFVPRSNYHSVTVKQGQSLEVVSPMQGG